MQEKEKTDNFAFLIKQHNIIIRMKDRNTLKRNYNSPLSYQTEVAFEQALLVATARLIMTVDETETVNTAETDAPGGEMYFEF